MRYLFGDSDLAARRLEVLASVYRDSSAEFILEAAPLAPRLVLDLGCGPGFTTRLLADLYPSTRVIGLDKSEHFISLAANAPAARTSFHRYDVTRTPFPEGPADLIYCRYLLTHLKEPANRLRDWASQLQGGGRLLIEEVEYIETSQPEFARYLEIVAAMLNSQGTELYIGAILNKLDLGETITRKMSGVRRLAVDDRDAAHMFSLNIPNWKANKFIVENIDAKEISGLERGLIELRDIPPGTSHITWGLRQICFERK